MLRTRQIVTGAESFVTEAAEMLAPGLPAADELLAGLRAVEPRIVSVLERRPNERESTFPTEVVSCRLADETSRTLFCKYSGGRDHAVYGHRRDVRYEAFVYASVLQAGSPPTVSFVGAFEASGGLCLVLEFVPDALPASRAEDDGAMRAAARWLGAFHADNESRALPELIQYDRDYYQGWLRRTIEFGASVVADPAWLRRLEAAFDRVVRPLLQAPQTVVHGEFYSGNLLFSGGRIYPVDWESAARAPGAIDLAMLTEEWPPETVAECVAAYEAARWPQGAPPDAAHLLECARVYVLLRWLGDRPHWTAASRYRFDHLHDACVRLGIVEAT